MKKVSNYFEKIYGAGSPVIINGITGTMYGNDECFDCEKYYQVLVVGAEIYHAYYDICETEMDAIDYANPYKLENATNHYADAI